MSREAIARAVVRLYPSAVRESRGELVGTLLDAGDASWWAYLGQLSSLARSGLSARARSELSQPLPQIGLSALCWAAVITVVWQLVTLAANWLRWGGGPGTERDLYSYILPISILTLLTLRRPRFAGALGLAWVAILLHRHLMLPMLPFSGTVPDVALQAAGFAILVIRPPSARVSGRLLWLALAVVFLLYQVTLYAQLSGIGRTTPFLVAMLFVPWAPSMVLGTAITWGFAGLLDLSLYGSGPGYSDLLFEAMALLATIPLALTAIATARIAFARDEQRDR